MTQQTCMLQTRIKIHPNDRSGASNTKVLRICLCVYLHVSLCVLNDRTGFKMEAQFLSIRPILTR